MGSGKWSTDVYKERERVRKSRGGSAFAYNDKVRKSGNIKPHPTLDPHGLRFRESRDSREHPESNSIAVLLDVTGSMGVIPRALQRDLPQLLGLLLSKQYVSSPQILFGAIGDAYSDKVPMQIGQFESDNRMDENLTNIIIEGGGGGQGKESYDLGLYFAAHHTAIDCFEKRGRKGYLFMVGDELAYDYVDHRQVKTIFGANIEENIALSEIIAEVRRKYHFFYVVPTGATPRRVEQVLGFWRELIGMDNVLTLEDAEAIAELIALTIGLNEGVIDFDTGMAHLREFEANASIVKSVREALEGFSSTAGGSSRAKGSGLGLDDDSGGGSTRRL